MRQNTFQAKKQTKQSIIKILTITKHTTKQSFPLLILTNFNQMHKGLPIFVIQQPKKPSFLPQPQSPTAHQLQTFSLSKQIQHLQQAYNQMKARFYTSPFYQQYSSLRQTLQTQLTHPLTTAYRHTYTQLPHQASKQKFKLLERFSYEQRFVLLNALALATALVTLRGVDRANGWRVAVRSLRNCALMYVGGGLVVAPEIFNPLLKGWEGMRVGRSV